MADNDGAHGAGADAEPGGPQVSDAEVSDAELGGPQVSDAEPVDSPATWENVVVGRAKRALGHLLHDEEYEHQGEVQEEVAHEVHEESESDGDRPRGDG